MQKEISTEIRFPPKNRNKIGNDQDDKKQSCSFGDYGDHDAAHTASGLYLASTPSP